MMCPTSTATGSAGCDTHCLGSGWGSITVDVRDANGNFLGTGVYNDRCGRWHNEWPGCI